MTKIFLIILSFVLLTPNFIDVNINQKAAYNLTERYSPQLSHITTIQQLEQYADSLATTKNIQQRSPEYFILLEGVIADRFYHGFSHYTLKENWLAAVSEKLFGKGLACKVVPEDIIQHQEAACSQQAIVMINIAKTKGIDYRSIGFPHHFAIELKVKNIWYYFDPNLEPHITKEQRSGLQWETMVGSLKKYYGPATQAGFDDQFGINNMPLIGAVNADPAPRVKYFHGTTFILSRTLWCLPLVLLFALSRRRKPATAVVATATKMNDHPAHLLPA